MMSGQILLSTRLFRKKQLLIGSYLWLLSMRQLTTARLISSYSSKKQNKNATVWKQRGLVLSLRLLLDEHPQSQILVKLLTGAGHDVMTINKIGLTGCTDDVVLYYYFHDYRILLARRCYDFEELHQSKPFRGLSGLP